MSNFACWCACLARRSMSHITVTAKCPPPCVTCTGLTLRDKLIALEKLQFELLSTKQAVSFSDGETAVTYDYSTKSLVAIERLISQLRYRVPGAVMPLRVDAS